MKTSTLVLPFLAAALSLLPSVRAHGFVYILGIDGQSYKGNIPQRSNDTPSPIRQVSIQDPIYGASNPSLNCGNNATDNAVLVVDAMPGSRLTFDWRGESLSHWPHNTGPMMTYLASCDSTTCDKFDSTTARWFKIDQVGQDGKGGWFQQQIMNGGLSNATLPDNLAPGEYLVRHEIIALHLALTRGKAEFYPSCQQIRVGGSGTGVPSSDQLLSFPGAYSDDDPGIFTPDVFNPGFQYVFPGGPIATLVTSPDGNNNNNGTGNPNSSGSLSCSLKTNKTLLKRSSARNRRSDPTRPHRVSRVMGRLLHGNTW